MKKDEDDIRFDSTYVSPETKRKQLREKRKEFKEYAFAWLQLFICFAPLMVGYIIGEYFLGSTGRIISIICGFVLTFYLLLSKGIRVLHEEYTEGKKSTKMNKEKEKN